MGSRLQEFVSNPQVRQRRNAAAVAGKGRVAKRWRNIAVCVIACLFGVAFVFVGLDFRPRGGQDPEALVRKVLRERLASLNNDQGRHATEDGTPTAALDSNVGGGDGGASARVDIQSASETDTVGPSLHFGAAIEEQPRVALDSALQTDEGGGGPCDRNLASPYIVDGECRECPTATHNYQGGGDALSASCTPCGLAGQAPCEAPGASACSLTLSRAYVLKGQCAECSRSNEFTPGSDLRDATCTPAFKCGALRQRACTGKGQQPCNASIRNAHIVRGRCYRCNTASLRNFDPGSGTLSATCTPCGLLGAPPCTNSDSPACYPGVKRAYIWNGRCAQCPQDISYTAGTSALDATCSNVNGSDQDSEAQPEADESAAAESDVESEPELGSNSGSEHETEADGIKGEDEETEPQGEGKASEQSVEQNALPQDEQSDGSADKDVAERDPCGGFERPYMVDGACVDCLPTGNNYDPAEGMLSASCAPCGRIHEPPCTASGVTPCSRSIFRPYVIDGTCRDCVAGTGEYVAGAGPLDASCDRTCGQLRLPPCQLKDAKVPACDAEIPHAYIQDGRCMSCALDTHYFEANPDPAASTCVPKLKSKFQQGQTPEPAPTLEPRELLQPGPQATREPEPSVEAEGGKQPRGDDGAADDLDEAREWRAVNDDSFTGGTAADFAADDDACGGRFEHPYMVDGACLDCLETNNNYVAGEGADSAECRPCGRVGEEPCSMPGARPCSGAIFQPYVSDGKCRDCPAGVSDYAAADGLRSATCTRNCGLLGMPTCSGKAASIPACDPTIPRPYVLDGKCASCDTTSNKYEAASTAAAASCTPCGADGCNPSGSRCGLHFDGYEFTRGADSDKGDLFNVPLSAELSEMLDACTGNPKCAGVNSRGYLKAKIRPVMEWSYVDHPDPCFGLFVKLPSTGKSGAKQQQAGKA